MFSLKSVSLLDFKKQTVPEQNNLRSIYRIEGGIPCDNQMRAVLDGLEPLAVRCSAGTRAEIPQRVLQIFGKSLETFRKTNAARFPVRVNQTEMIKKMRKRLPVNGHIQLIKIGKVARDCLFCDGGLPRCRYLRAVFSSISAKTAALPKVFPVFNNFISLQYCLSVTICFSNLR